MKGEAFAYAKDMVFADEARAHRHLKMRHSSNGRQKWN